MRFTYYCKVDIVILESKGEGAWEHMLTGHDTTSSAHGPSQYLILLRGSSKRCQCLDYILEILDVVVGQCPAILKLLASKDQPHLIQRSALLVLDLGLNTQNSVRGLNINGDVLPCQSLDKDPNGITSQASAEFILIVFPVN